MQWKMRHTSRCDYHWRAAPCAKLTLCCGITVKRTSTDREANRPPAFVEGRKVHHKAQFATGLPLTTSESVAGFGGPSAFATTGRRADLDPLSRGSPDKHPRIPKQRVIHRQARRSHSWCRTQRVAGCINVRG